MDLDKPDQAEAFKLEETMRPKLLLGSSERKSWSQLQNLSKDKQLFEARRKHSWRHLQAVTQMCHRQADGSQLCSAFAFERSRIWNVPSIQGILRKGTVSTGIRNDLCAKGLTVNKLLRGR